MAESTTYRYAHTLGGDAEEHVTAQQGIGHTLGVPLRGEVSGSLLECRGDADKHFIRFQEEVARDTDARQNPR
jgi:hypothetical protein